METEMQEAEEGVLNYTYSASYPNLLERYDLVKEIGSGAQATVFLCRSKRGKKQFACKTISIEKAEYTKPAEEIEIMQKLASSPGIILLHEVIIDDGYWHLIMELCECSLVDLIMNRGRLCEKEAALLIRNLSLAIQDLHQNGIIHRDLKPDNILVVSTAKPYDVRVSDFGISARFTCSPPNFTSQVGTDGYFAPEVLQGYYSTEIDIWGLGLILYQSLTGFNHFPNLETGEIGEKLLNGEDLAVSELEWPAGMISEEARNLVLAMLRPDPEERISLQQILSHPWIAKYSVACERRRLRRTKIKIPWDMMHEQAAAESLNHKRPCNEDGTCMLPSKLIKLQGTSGSLEALKPCATAC